MKVAVYLSAVPLRASGHSKRSFLMKFAQGVAAAGDDVEIVDRIDRVIPADIAVLQGWVGMKAAPHLQQRKQVIEYQASKGRHTLIIDSNLFGFLEPLDRDRYLRYSLDGIFPTTGYYFDRDCDPERWKEIRSSYGCSLKEWQMTGSAVLVCLQRNEGWSMRGMQVIDWMTVIMPHLQNSGRPVVIRPHPGDPRTASQIRYRWPGVEVSSYSDIRQDLDRAWCTVTYNSSPAVASLLCGVPAFVTDSVPENSQAWPCVGTDLAFINDPPRPDRTQLFEKLSQCHHATASLETGQAWQFMRARLP